MTDDARRGLDRLTQHAERLGKLIRLLGAPVRVVPTREDMSGMARELHGAIRLALRRDYDEGEQRELSKAERAYVQPALIGAYAEMSDVTLIGPQRMLSETTKAHRVIHGALQELREPSGDDEGA
jgi:hypothetical protein